MKERPILFNGPMVRSILDGHKTQHRVVVKPAPVPHETVTGPMWEMFGHGGYFAPHVFGACAAKMLICPLGRPGDRLWASRITLEVLTVRVERLRDISFEDESAEGVPGFHFTTGHPRRFHSLWDSISEPGSRWLDNPWVWVVEFERVMP